MKGSPRRLTLKGKTKAERKVEKAIDAMIELQDYPEILEAAGVRYEVQLILDKLNHISICIEGLS